MYLLYSPPHPPFFLSRPDLTPISNPTTQTQQPTTMNSPGWTHTGITTSGNSLAPKPPGAWSAQETVLFMLDRVRFGEFYILCPDNETRPEIDHLRIMWNAADVTEGRPALSRWHPNYKSLYEEYVRENMASLD